MAKKKLTRKQKNIARSMGEYLEKQAEWMVFTGVKKEDKKALKDIYRAYCIGRLVDYQ